MYLDNYLRIMLGSEYSLVDLYKNVEDYDCLEECSLKSLHVINMLTFSNASYGKKAIKIK